MISPRPVRCKPFTKQIRDEYGVVRDAGLAPALRAWVRETEQVCRANAALLQE